MIRTFLSILILAAGALAAPGEGIDTERLAEDAMRAYEAGDLSTAADAFRQLAEARPNDPHPPYNLACVRARQGDADGAIEALHESIERGFVDFHHMQRDDDLASLRERPDFVLIILGWSELLEARAEADMASAKEALGGRYTYATDDALRLNIASSFDQRSTDEAIAEIRRTAAWADRALFGDLGVAPPNQPDHWVSLLLPTPEHFRGFVPMPGVGGIYDRDRRLLVSQDLGPSLRHEFLHVLHHRVMDRLGQQHAYWVQEGLGAVVEDMSAESGADTPVPSWRTNIVKRLEARNRLMPWRTFFAMPRDRFVRQRPNANYAQARTIMLFLADQGRLLDWMRAYTRIFDEDPTGAAAMQEVFDQPLAQVERAYKAWVRELPEVAEEIRPGMPSLGVVIEPGVGEGPVIVDVAQRARAADGDRLRRGDVITSVARQATRTPEDLVRILAEQDVGDEVEVAVRRGTLRLVLRITLVPLEREDSWAPGVPSP